jgi:putative heme-binding domain-containing protein
MIRFSMLHAIILFPVLATLSTRLVLAEIKTVDFALPLGFVAEEIYQVPNAEQGSWICLTADERGRLIASDQRGSLYRLTVPDPTNTNSAVVEKIDLDIGMAMGLLYYRESLYVMVNGSSADGPGLYRVRDTNKDDQFDSIELLRGIEPPGKPGAGHGNHAIVPSPDGRSLYIVCGNMAGKPIGGFDSSRVPMNWGEDQLLPRLADSGGHASKIKAPGGWIAKTDLNGQHWELVCSGFRNVYDAAFNQEGDLFTFDADMEFDLGTPWYRPTRVCHVVSGGEFGWRNGSGKWPAYYPDNLPSAIDIGLGSPTGVTFGYETNFPAPYRDALFLCDWSYGRIYTTELKKSGATYAGNSQLFASFAPLPVVDVIVHPQDQSLYLVTGGRGVQSHIYRIRYQGTGKSDATAASGTQVARDEVTDNVPDKLTDQLTDKLTDDLHSQRRSLEQLHAPSDMAAIDRIWPQLNHDDRFIRYAARIALEHQPVEHWQSRLFAEADPRTIIAASIALARCAENVGLPLQEKLRQLQIQDLDPELQLDLLRAFGLAFIRHGRPTESVASQLVKSLRSSFPSTHSGLNREQSRMLAYLGDAESIEPLLQSLESVESRDEQMHIALVLRTFDDDWTIDQRRRYFEWFRRANDFTGGRTGGEFARQIRQDAEASLNDDARKQLRNLLASLESRPTPEPMTQSRPMVKKWTITDLIPNREMPWQAVHAMKTDAKRGEQMFSAAMCNRCHQLRGQGGRVGPNLSGATRRFSPHDLLEAILEPGKTIPHDFEAVKILTEDGKIVVGQVVNYGGGGMSVRTNQMEPWKLTKIDADSVETITPSTVSLMPAGLLDTLQKDEIFDLLKWMAGQ